MVQYLLYKKANAVTPFVIVNENTIDSSSTSVYLVGKRKESYGQPEQQSKLWMLENFANSTQPSPAILGQHWFNTADGKMYNCVDEGAQLFEKVNKPIVSASAPLSNITSGDLWWNTTDGLLYVYNGATLSWIQAGTGFFGIPSSVEETAYLTGITTDGTPTEIFVSGVSGSRLVVPANTAWNFEVKCVARRNSATTEALAINFSGIIDRPNAGPVALIPAASSEKVIFGKSAALATAVDVAVSADTVNQSLSVMVTGEAAKNINWVATVKLTKITFAP